MPGGLDGRGGEAALVEVLSGLQLAVQVKDLVVEKSTVTLHMAMTRNAHLDYLSSIGL